MDNVEKDICSICLENFSKSDKSKNYERFQCIICEEKTHSICYGSELVADSHLSSLPVNDSDQVKSHSVVEVDKNNWCCQRCSHLLNENLNFTSIKYDSLFKHINF